MAEPTKKHNFSVGKKADGSTAYLIDGSEVPDKTTWANLRQKSMDAGTQSMDAVEQEADAAMSSSGNSELDSMFSKAKGGRIKAGKISTHKKSKSAPSW
jgi:hypothetical protein